MVPGSTLMYGSSFCIVTRRPRLLRRRPREAAVMPLPRELATPPVTKMCLVTGDQTTPAAGDAVGPLGCPGRRTAGKHGQAWDLWGARGGEAADKSVEA